MNHRLLYIVGPSGAGKDSLLGWLRGVLPPAVPLHFARRTITRVASASGSEQHESVEAPLYERLLQADAFGLAWQANGLGYGVRHAELAPLDRGQWVLVNGSRGDLPAAARAFPGLTVAHVTAAAEVLRQRLIGRGREPAEQIEARIRRAVFASALPAEVGRSIVVHNDGALAEAGESLRAALRTLPGWPEPAAP